MSRFTILLLLAPSLLLAGPSIRETDEAIHVTLRDRPVLRYLKAVQMPPDGVDPIYQRSGYIHPVHTPSGKVVSGDFPSDHYHQHALFFAWTSTHFQGRKVDFWNQKAGTGRIEHVAVESIDEGDASSSFTVKIRHSDLSAPEGEIAILEELWTVTIFDTPEGEPFRFDIVSRQKNTSKSPLTLDEYHYGGMALRGSNEWIDSDFAKRVKEWEKRRQQDPETPPMEDLPFRFLTSEGKGFADGNHSRPNWVDLSGPVGGEPAGAALLGHPENFRFPQPVRLHPSKPYFCFAPVVPGEFQIQPGEEYVSRYRCVAHDGAPDVELLDAQWEAFAKTTATE